MLVLHKLLSDPATSYCFSPVKKYSAWCWNKSDYGHLIRTWNFHHHIKSVVLKLDTLNCISRLCIPFSANDIFEDTALTDVHHYNDMTTWQWEEKF